MIRAILFDLDGTLLDRDRSVRKFIRNQYDRFTNEFRHVDKDTYISRFLELDCRGYVWKDIVYRQLVNELTITKVTAKQLELDYVTNFRKSCIGFPNLLVTLEKLKTLKLTLGMITNGFGEFQMNNIKELRIEEFFRSILISESEGIKKPMPEIFLRACNNLKVIPSQCIFVGDHPINDIEAAKHVGMKTIWMLDEMVPKPVNADYSITNLMEIIEIVERLDIKETD